MFFCFVFLKGYILAPLGKIIRMLKLITEVYIGDLAVKLYFNLLASLKTTDFLKNKNKFSQFFSLGKAVEKLEKNVNVLKVLTE